MPLLELLSAVARELLGSILSDFRLLPVYVIIFFLIKTRYERCLEFQTDVYGRERTSLRKMVEETVLYGLVAGFVSSIAVVALGFVISIETFYYIFFIMAVLVLVNTRYVCFSYSGGILALIGLVFGLSNINIPGILSLVAVMHIAESVLIFASAKKESTPVYIKHGDGIAGAYITQRFWPVPVVFLTFLAQNALSGTVYQGAPGLFTGEMLNAGAAALGLDCVIGVLSYSDVAVVRQPEEKSRQRALQIFIYSVLLLLAGYLSMHFPFFKIAGIVFCIAGHEGIILYDRYKEKKGKPLFEPVKRGLKIFDILPGSHAEKIGLQRGDVILGINGKDIQTEEGMAEAIKDSPRFVWLTIIDTKGTEKTLEYKCFPEGLSALGIISLPREREVTYNIDHFENLIIIKNLVARFRGVNRTF